MRCVQCGAVRRHGQLTGRAALTSRVARGGAPDGARPAGALHAPQTARTRHGSLSPLPDWDWDSGALTVPEPPAPPGGGGGAHTDTRGVWGRRQGQGPGRPQSRYSGSQFA